MSDDHGGGGGFFGRQVSQSVRIDEKGETRQIVKGTLIFWLFLWISAWMLYFLVNISIGSVGVQIITAVSAISGSVSLAFFLNRFALRFWPKVLYQLRRDGAPVITIKLKHVFILLGLILSVLATLLAIPYMELLMVFPSDSTLNTKLTRLALYGSVMVGVTGIVALAIGSWRFFFEITDRHHAALEIQRDKMKLDYERENREWLLNHPGYGKAGKTVINQAQLPDHSSDRPFILVNTSSRKANITPSERDDPESFWVEMTVQFLRGIERRAWSTAETSWIGKTIPGTRFKVSSIAPTIQKGLIAGGLAAWRHPSDPRQGWDLLDTPANIIATNLFVSNLKYQDTNDNDADTD